MTDSLRGNQNKTEKTQSTITGTGTEGSTKIIPADFFGRMIFQTSHLISQLKMY
jgi:hypothetical protein